MRKTKETFFIIIVILLLVSLSACQNNHQQIQIFIDSVWNSNPNYTLTETTTIATSETVTYQIDNNKIMNVFGEQIQAVETKNGQTSYFEKNSDTWIRYRNKLDNFKSSLLLTIFSEISSRPTIKDFEMSKSIYILTALGKQKFHLNSNDILKITIINNSEFELELNYHQKNEPILTTATINNVQTTSVDLTNFQEYVNDDDLKPLLDLIKREQKNHTSTINVSFFGIIESQTMLVDNTSVQIIASGQSNYFEVSEDGVYVYEEIAGQWYKHIDDNYSFSVFLIFAEQIDAQNFTLQDGTFIANENNIETDSYQIESIVIILSNDKLSFKMVTKLKMDSLSFEVSYEFYDFDQTIVNLPNAIIN